ncbi:MAG: hypothetical protein EA370_16035 [Wenzhouxiangella sp.]|nr:MAG: hypothetical protein EA370_16035 [Wenzhouxiangella sp.]
MSDSLLAKIRKFLSRDFREQIEKRDKLKKLLAKIRKKQKKLQDELSEEYDPVLQDELRTKIRLLEEQRRKGLDLLKELREARKQA